MGGRERETELEKNILQRGRKTDKDRKTYSEYGQNFSPLWYGSLKPASTETGYRPLNQEGLESGLGQYLQFKDQEQECWSLEVVVEFN